VDVNTPAAWIAAPTLVIAGLVVVVARKQLGDRFARQHASLRDRFPFLSGAAEPIWLRPMVTIVGTIWLLVGLVLLGVLRWG
jgi:hypothetical protein